jgi:hypothetical protein
VQQFYKISKTLLTILNNIAILNISRAQQQKDNKMIRINSTVVHKDDDMDDPVFGTVVNRDGALVTVRWDDDDDIV